MKIKTSRSFARVTPIVGMLSTFTAAYAGTGTWTATTNSGNWTDTTKWAAATIADGADATANFTSNITATTTVTLAADRAIGNLVFSDNGASGSAWIVTGNTLSLAVSSGAPAVTTTTDASIASIVGGTAGFAKSGLGKLTLSGANTYTGVTTVNGGTLALDYSADNSSKVDAASQLVLGGGALSLTANGTADTTQTVTGLQLNGGGGSITLTKNAGSNNATLATGAITRAAGGTLNVVYAGTGTGTAAVTTSTGNDATGILGAWASAGTGASTQYATNSAGNVAGYAGTAAADANAFVSATDNYDFATADTTVLSDNRTANTIRFTGAAAHVIDLSTNDVIQDLTLNGIMNAGSGLLTIQRTAGSGFLVVGSSQELVANTANAGITISSSIADNLGGASGVTKTGSGTLTLAGGNFYTGATSVNSGTLTVTNAGALGSTDDGTNIASGGRVLVDANALTIAENFTLNGMTSGGTLVSGDRAANNITNLSGTITLAADANVGNWWNDKSMTLSGKITGAGGLTFDRATSVSTGDPVGGKFIVSNAANDYAGNTVVNGRAAGVVFGYSGNAILQLGAANALPTTTTLTLNNANLSLNGNNQTLAGLIAATSGTTVDSNGILSTNSGVGATGAVMASQIVNGSATAAMLTVNNAAANTFAGVLGGPGTNENNFAFTKGGAGAAILSGANTFNGGTTINGGSIQMNAVSSLGSGAVNMSAGCSLAFNVGNNSTVANAITLNGSTLVGSMAAGTIGVTNSGVLTLQGTDPNLVTTEWSDKRLTFSNKITGSGGLTVDSQSYGVKATPMITMSGATANDYTGTTSISGGVLNLNKAANVVAIPGNIVMSNRTKSALIYDSGNATLVFAANGQLGGSGVLSFENQGATPLAAHVNINGTSQSIAGLNESNGLGIVQNWAGITKQSTNVNNNTDAARINASGTLTLTGSAAYSFNGTLRDGDASNLTNTLSLVMAGTGTQTLAGTSSYTGTTAVNAGTLRITGTKSGAGAVTVGNTGTLGGNGSIAGVVTIQSGGTVAPGASAGTLTFTSDVDVQSGSKYAAEIASAASFDKIVTSGNLTVNGTIKVTLLDGYSPAVDTVFDLADAATISGTPAFDFTAATLSGGMSWDTTSFGTNGTIKVVAGGSDPFDAWATANNVTGGKAGDDDKDGVSNLLEFATAANPQSGSSGARVYPLVHVIGGQKVLTYTVAVRASATFAANGAKQQADKDGVRYVVEASDNLGTWDTVVVSELDSGDATAVRAALGGQLDGLDAAWQWHSFRTDGDAASDASDFIRLNVSVTP